MFLPQKILDETPQFKENLEKFLNGQMEDAFFRGIRVPWGFYSQRGGKILMSRLRVPGGILTPRQLHSIASAAKKYSEGTLHITTRQDIQIHDVPYRHSYEIVEYLKDVHISPRGGGGNTVRNITGCYLSGICPHEHHEIYQLVWGLSEYLLSFDDSYTMPRKIKISFSGCERDCAYAGVNDIGFVALKDGFKVLCGGGMGAKSGTGKILHERIDPSEIGYYAKATINLFNKYGDRKNRHHNRLRFLIQDLGWEEYKKRFTQELTSAKEKESITLKTEDTLPPLSELSSPPSPPDESHEDGTPYAQFLQYSCGKQKQDGYRYVHLRIPFGEIGSDDLNVLAALSDAIPTLIFRTTQRQSLIISNVPAHKLPLVYEKLQEIFKDSFLLETPLDIVCCKGATTCNIGICNSVGLSSEILKELRTLALDKESLKHLTINVNGCPNACGHHPIGMISFSGMARKINNRSVPFYKVHLGGKPDAENTILAEPVGRVPARAVPKLFSDFITTLPGGSEESVYHYVTQQGKSAMIRLIEKYSSVPPYEDDRSYYVDCGNTEDFSLTGFTKGECGSGAVDMVESDLDSAKHCLESAEEKEYDLQEIKIGLIYSSRALLVIKGIDPKEEGETIRAFKEKFINPGVCSPEFEKIESIYQDITTDNIKKEDAFEHAKHFYEEVKKIYSLMDSSFNFPTRFPKHTPQEDSDTSPVKTAEYDLRGTPCPINYVKVKLKLEELSVGNILVILIDYGEPIESVPKSLEKDGQEIVSIEKQEGFFKVTVKKRV